MKPCAHGSSYEDCATCSDEGYQPASPPPEVVVLVRDMIARGIDYGTVDNWVYEVFRAEGKA